MQVNQLAAVSQVRNAGLQTEGAALNQEVEGYRQALKALQKAESDFAALPLDPEEKALLDQAIASRRRAEPVIDEAAKFTMAFAGEEAAKVLTTQLGPIQAEWAKHLSQLAELQHTRSARRAAEITADNDRKAAGLAALLAVVTLGGAAFAVVLTRSVTRPLRRAVEVASRVAEGDLAVRIDAQGNDEAADLLRSLQVMAGQLSSMVGAVGQASESITTASAEISQGNLDLSQRTERQAASLQETAATLTELTETVSRNSAHAEQARALAEHTAGVAQRSGAEVEQVVQTMNRIREAS